MEIWVLLFSRERTRNTHVTWRVIDSSSLRIRCQSSSVRVATPLPGPGLQYIPRVLLIFTWLFFVRLGEFYVYRVFYTGVLPFRFWGSMDQQLRRMYVILIPAEFRSEERPRSGWRKTMVRLLEKCGISLPSNTWTTDVLDGRGQPPSSDNERF